MIPDRGASPSTGRSRTRTLQAAVAALFLAACALTVYITLHSISAHEARDKAAIGDQVHNVAREIEGYLAERQDRVQAFAVTHRDLLNALASAPDNLNLRQSIAVRLRKEFPGYFTFTLADRDGHDLIDDLEGFVGEACVASIRSYVSHLTSGQDGDGNYRTVIHPQANNYHFDVMAPWTDGEQVKGVFFVSFFPTVLRGALQANQGEGHQLAIVNQTRPSLLEVNTLGARDKISVRRDINLTDDERARIAATEDIALSHWRVIGYPNADAYAQYRADAWLKAAIALSLICLVAGASMLAISRRRTT